MPLRAPAVLEKASGGAEGAPGSAEASTPSPGPQDLTPEPASALGRREPPRGLGSPSCLLGCSALPCDTCPTLEVVYLPGLDSLRPAVLLKSVQPPSPGQRDRDPALPPPLTMTLGVKPESWPGVKAMLSSGPGPCIPANSHHSHAWPTPCPHPPPTFAQIIPSI